MKKYYSLDNILKCMAHYNLIIGERSNGKTYSVEDYGVKDYAENKNQMAIIRRWKDDFTGKRGEQMFSALVNNGLVEKYTNGLWNNISYRSSRWYFSRFDEKLDRMVLDSEPFCFAFALSSGEHDKSISFPKVKTILFDEFLTRNGELPNEFVEFMNVISTIVRGRNDVKIFMCGNTVNPYSSYFTEMGIKKIKQMKKGTIDVYTYGNSDLRVAVEYSDNPSKKKDSDLYFAFDNPKLQMITGGVWELGIFPHLPMKYVPKDIIFTYFIIYENEIYQCEIIEKDILTFTYIHRKTTPLKDEDNDLIYSQEFNSKPNFRRKITQSFSDFETKILNFFRQDKVFYQDNEVGNAIMNYIMWCKSDSITNR